jgi:branched-chain amino acid transport system substrate-binding protein
MRSILFAAAAIVASVAAGPVLAQGKELKIGVIYDLTGAFAAGGSNASYLGTKYAIDMIN